MIENKKQYVKPDFAMMHFELNDNVAACTETEESTWAQQTASCIIDGSETIFISQCGDYSSNYAAGILYNYNGTWYFLWYTGDASGTPPNSETTELLNSICSAAGATSYATDDSGSYKGWHAGTVSDTVVSTWNSSY